MVRAILREDRVPEEAEKIAKQIKGISKGKVRKVLDTLIADRQNNKRQPAPPAPKGGIGIRAAGRKCEIANPTISAWVKKGYIPVILRTKNTLYIDESELLKVVELYKKNPGQGKNTLKKLLNSNI